MFLNLKELPAAPWPAPTISNGVSVGTEQRSLLKYMPPTTGFARTGWQGRAAGSAVHTSYRLTATHRICNKLSVQFSMLMFEPERFTAKENTPVNRETLESALGKKKKYSISAGCSI